MNIDIYVAVIRRGIMLGIIMLDSGDRKMETWNYWHRSVVYEFRFP